MTQVFAHRGASKAAPENTMPAFELAEKQGADGIELDVHLTSDGEMVVIHDDTVNRTTNGAGAVRGMTFGELRELDASLGRQGFSGVRIPTLAEVYAMVAKTRLLVNVEIKEDRMENGSFAVLRPLLALTERYGLESRVIYSSFNHYALRELAALAPKTSRAVLYEAALVDVWEYAARVPANGIHPWFGALRDPLLVASCHARGIAVRPWTVDREEDLAAAFRAGADAVITDLPDVAQALR